MGRSLAIAVAVTCACAGKMPAPEAVPPWSPLVQVAGSNSLPAREPSLAFGSAGRGIVAWAGAPVPTNLSVGVTARFAALAGAGPGPARDLAPYAFAAPSAAYGRTRTIVLLRPNTAGSRPGENGDSPQDVAVAVGAGGALATRGPCPARRRARPVDRPASGGARRPSRRPG